MGVMVGVGVSVGVGVDVGVEVGDGVTVNVAVAVARNGGRVTSVGALQANAPTINTKIDNKPTFRRMVILSPGKTGLSMSYLSYGPSIPRLGKGKPEPAVAIDIEQHPQCSQSQLVQYLSCYVDGDVISLEWDAFLQISRCAQPTGWALKEFSSAQAYGAPGDI